METISIDKELFAFKDRLNFNERAIFSAKFGDGKTFFLNKFKKKFSNDYECITIYPVNYQIADNKEVFEYIKRDILIQMVAKNMIEPSYEIPEHLMFQFFIMQKSYSFLGSLLQILPNLGVPEETASLFLAGYNTLNWSKKLTEKFKKYKDAIQSQDEIQIIETFLESFSKKSGSPYEIDLITQIIIDNIQWFRDTNNKKVILIIEDLDRMDPAHLFRILNIFSAHIDRVYQYKNDNTHKNEDTTYPELLPNKFGFDNIITVFDYNTTENIFHHFYGKDANYQGYINKFTSYQPFFYSIDKIAREYLYQFILKKCCISRENIRNTNLIKDKLDSLSVRDIKNILNGVDSYIDGKIFQFASIKINTKSPLTYTIAILKFLGIQDIESIIKYILNLPAIDLLNCINVFLLVLNKTRSGNFKYRGGTYIFKNSIDFNQVINKIEIIEGGLYALPSKLNDEDLQICFNEALNYIKK